MILVSRLLERVRARVKRQRAQQDAICVGFKINRCLSCRTLPFIVGLETVGNADESVSIMCVNPHCKVPASTVTTLPRALAPAVQDWNRINGGIDNGAEMFAASVFTSFNAFLKARASREEFRPLRALDDGVRINLTPGSRNQFSD